MDIESSIVARFLARCSEIQWRGVQRDGITIFAFVLCAGLATIKLELVAPIPLLFVAAIWRQHDKRIGSGAAYLREAVEPRLHQVDSIESYEEYLNRVEKRTSSNNRWSFSALTARLFFPTLQISLLALGVYHYAVERHHSGILTSGVVVVTIVGVAITIVTWLNVKHERVPVADE